MNKTLAIVAAIGLAVSALCLSAAAAIGGRDIIAAVQSLDHPDRPWCPDNDTARATSRDLEWNGGDRVSLNIRADVHYRPGTGDTMHVTGDPRRVAHVRVRDGRIEYDCNPRNGWDGAGLDITLPGRAFARFSVAGSGRMTLNALDQDMLKVSIAGSGSVHADGKADHVKIEIAGSGDAIMPELKADAVEVSIAGSGDADVAPVSSLHANIAGSGDVRLRTDPKTVDTRIAGSGRVTRDISRSDTPPI